MDELKMLAEEDMDRRLKSLTDEEKEYFKLLISHLVRGFSDPDYSCVLVVRLNARGTVSVCSVDADEAATTDILNHACDVLSFADTVGIPNRGEFH
tara:strand:- start:8 stop:295 length:288 start_codon:yes stop_codon:yes gene_type:complete